MADGSDGLVDDGDDDALTVPFYERDVAPVEALALFAGEPAQGTWKLLVCDTEALDRGTLRQWSLFFESAR